MSATGRAWVLNLDAEHELEVVGAFTPSRHLRELVVRERRHLIGSLVGPDDVLLTGAASDRKRARGRVGVAWCPTPRAIAQLAASGAIPAAAPAVQVLRDVNARPFATRVRKELVAGSFDKWTVTELDDALARLAMPAFDGWLVRRCFGAAGRGRRRIAAGKPSAAELSWLVASLRLGTLVIEPWVRVTREYTRSGWVRRDGQVLIAAPCFQQVSAQGAWKRTECAERGELKRTDDEQLARSAAAAGSALAAAGYFGPFGIDAFRHRVPGRPGASDVLNPLSEINARYTMDWTTGMSSRPDLDAVAVSRAEGYPQADG